jgi:hypothetical protein
MLRYTLIAGLAINFNLLSLEAGKLARSQYPEGPEDQPSRHSWFPWVLEQMLGWFLTLPSCHYMLHM